jgi:hypothetical protein
MNQEYILYVDNQICMNQQAIRAEMEKGDYQPMRDTLIEVVKREHDLSRKRQKHIDDYVKEEDFGPTAGFLPMVFQTGANMDSQIEALNLLAPYLEEDDRVYETMFEATLHKYSNITNVGDTALEILAAHEGRRKEDLLKTGRDPKLKTEERVTAYRALVLNRLPNREGMEYFLEIARDRSTRRLYEDQGMLTPKADFEYGLDKKYNRKNKPDQELKEKAVEKAQRDFCLQSFSVLEQVMRKREKSFMLELKEKTDQRRVLTNTLSYLTTRYPSYQVGTFCSYVRRTDLEGSEAVQAYRALRSVIGTFETETQIDNIISALTDLYPKVKNKI